MNHLDTIVYSRPRFQIGTFRCPVDHPSFEDTGPTQGYLMVFPRTSVRITHSGGEPVVADRNTVMFYNARQAYRRGWISPRGDTCDWFAVPAEAAADAAAPFDPDVEQRPDRPFVFDHGPSPDEVYLLQRRFVQADFATCDPWAIEETVLEILRRTVAAAYRARRRPRRRRRSATRRSHAELAAAARESLARSFRGPVTLAALAKELHSSPFHLSRVFRERVGLTLHRYLTQLRLRAALDAVEEPGCNLSALAHDLGFSSHSHFGAAFRRTFGATPSRLRRSLSKAKVAALRQGLAV